MKHQHLHIQILYFYSGMNYAKYRVKCCCCSWNLKISKEFPEKSRLGYITRSEFRFWSRTVWCNQIGDDFVDMSSWIALIWNIGTKTSFKTKFIRSKNSRIFTMEILFLKSYSRKCIHKVIQHNKELIKKKYEHICFYIFGLKFCPYPSMSSNSCPRRHLRNKLFPSDCITLLI